MATTEEKTENEIVAPEAVAPEEKKGKGKMILMIILPLIVLILGAVVFLFFTETGRHMRGHDSKEAKVEKPLAPEKLVFFTIPELMVNLIPNGKKTPFLRLGVKLELPDAEAQKIVEVLLPRIIDQFQMYLRELRLEDIEGSAGVHRLKEELLKRVNMVTKTLKVKDVLFEVILVQ